MSDQKSLRTWLHDLSKADEIIYGLFAKAAGTPNRYEPEFYVTPGGTELPVVALTTRDRGRIPVAYLEGYLPAASEHTLAVVQMLGEKASGLRVIPNGRTDAVVQCTHESFAAHVNFLGNVRRKIKQNGRLYLTSYPSYAELEKNVTSKRLYELFRSTFIEWIRKEVPNPVVDPEVLVNTGDDSGLLAAWGKFEPLNTYPYSAIGAVRDLSPALLPKKSDTLFEPIWVAATLEDGTDVAVSFFVYTVLPSGYTELYWVNTWLDRTRNQEMLDLNIGTRMIAYGLELAYTRYDKCDYNMGFDWFPYKFNAWHATRLPKRGLEYVNSGENK